MMTDLELAHHYALALLCKQAREMDDIREWVENKIIEWNDVDQNVAEEFRDLLAILPNH